MRLFQKSVEKKYLNDLDTALIDKKYTDFLKHFGNPEIQENIRNSNEEQYQGEFLIDLFVNILGYIKNPTPNFNLTTELKNISNSKKADGAILNGEDAIAVIELKGTNTTDLDKIETQAFGYKNHHPKCKYVITSNFEKLRFYIQNAVDHIDFDLFNLTREQFSLLWVCLAKDNLLTDLPLKIKESSVLQEENITKKLYADYSKFREAIYTNLVKNNPETDKLLLFKKTQKLLDRFLFIFFAEDRLLLPPNSISEIVKQWADLKEKYDEYFPLYSRFKKYFEYMNTGYNGKKYDIYAYNGGLFKPDEVLDNITIDDDILYEHTLRLSNYDFETDVDVNILGHIFEHSLGEIEDIQKTIADEFATPEHATGHLQTSPQTKGEHAPRVTSKRKKDGIFYTPKYITKYIVENTVGKLCEEKRAELEIIDEEYAKGRKNRRKEIVRTLDKKLDDYRNWLLTLTILDPSCGSGAFLNQALEFLINEHRKIDELRGQLLGGAIIFSDITSDILEKNIYGVDLNEESVEIAKLSLWLRTAQKGRKLNTLSNNIKCGNSLIDDPEVAGEKAFYWQKEFPNIFQKKNKKAWHVTTATHNSRYSQRMFDNHVKKGEPVWLSEKEEIIVTETVAEIAEKDGLNIIAYNICGDHAHIILSCTEEELPKIVQKIKAMSARACNIAMGRTTPRTGQGEHAPRKENPDAEGTREHAPAYAGITNQENGEHAPLRGKTQFHLWAEKFNGKEITSNEQLENTIAYINNNRKKHSLPENMGLQSLVQKMICTRAHAFRTEYTGGFDVVIGNPPYVRKQGLMENYPEMCEFYEKKYKSATANYDIYALFMERSFDLIQEKGTISFILPHKFLVTDFGVGIRQFFKENHAVQSILHFGSEMVFADASTYTCIVNLNKTKKDKVFFKKMNPLEINNPFDWDYMLYQNLSEKNWDLQSQKIFDLIDILKQQPYTIDNVFKKIFVGLQTSLDAVYVFKGIDKGSYIHAYNAKYGYHFEIEKELVKPFIKGNEISKYKALSNIHYVLFPYEKDGKAILEDYIKNNLPKTYDYLKHFEAEIRGREKGRMDIDEGWYLYIYQKNHEKFPNPKIMTQEISLGCNMTYDEKGEFYHPTTIYSFVKNQNFNVDDKFYLGILNSKIMWFFLKNTGTELRGGYFRFKTNYLKPFPLPEIPENPNTIIDKVNSILSFNKDLQEISAKFRRTLEREFYLEILSKKLENWFELNYIDLLKELSKQKIELTLSQKAEWEDYFLKEQQKAISVKSEIEKTDKEIDQMVYELYGLTEEEIKIVENS
jgi:type I restriction-modification system DNA methylase subunit/REP element-mobilizing transposase RayT